ncbi:MAG: glycoside hydrolase family 3 C-terminal domain-containing protein, partial [Saprospiraceae bacterium]|nr:glycoside hydrolase family 3 C-terminal domain-containing protein [Saprospiraceae bacterium]
LPECHNRLIGEIARRQPNTVVVLMNGSAVIMPWAKQVKAIVEAWLGGQAGGEALARMLTGKINPSGKLSETFPHQLRDTPAFLNFPGKNGDTLYGEGVFVGYRYYEKKRIEPLFPFGFGLSYTSFSYSGLKISPVSLNQPGEVEVEFSVQNTGERAGKEVVQLYVREENPFLTRPDKELKRFAKIELQPEETKTLVFTLRPRDFASYDLQAGGWRVHPGEYVVLVGGSSADTPLQEILQIEAGDTDLPHLTRYSMLKEFAAHPKGRETYEQLVEGIIQMVGSTDDDMSDIDRENREKAANMMRSFLDDMPIFKMVAFTRGAYSEEMIEELLAKVNDG